MSHESDRSSDPPLAQSLRGQLLFVLLALTALPALLIGGLAYRNARQTVQERVVAELTSVADLKEEQINTWLTSRTSDVRLIADNFLNEEHFTEILDPSIPQERRDAFAGFLVDNMRSIQQAHDGYTEIFFVDRDGNVILSTDQAHVGMNRASHPAVANTLASDTGEHIEDVYRASETGQIEMAFGHVLRAVDLPSMTVTSEINGAVIIRVRMDETIYPLLHAWPGRGETGETMLVRNSGDSTVVLNPLRFREDAALNLTLPAAGSESMLPAHRAAMGQEGYDAKADYREVQVLAAYRSIPRTGWGVVVKKDLSEAFRPVTDLTHQWLLITLLVLVAAGVTAGFFSRTLSDPLARLVNAARAVAAGNFDTDLGIQRDDEIGSLAESFRTMTAAIRERDAHLREHAQEVTDLLNLSQHFVSLLNPEQVLEAALDHCQRMFSYDFSTILLLADGNEDGNEHLTATTTQGWPSQLAENLTVPIGAETAVGYAAQQRMPILVEDVAVEDRFEAPAVVRDLEVRSALAVPMLTDKHLVGVFWLLSRQQQEWDDEHIQLASLVANQTAVALERARLFQDLTESYDQTLKALATALSTRDDETEGHSRRVVEYTMALAEQMGLPAERLSTIRRGALLHDIGKIGVPDAILLKPGPLTDEERHIMQRHPALGHAILSDIPFLKEVADIILAHHEWWDGSGYPQGLEGEAIPLGARIFAVADAFDAMTSDRPYRSAQPYAVAREEIAAGSGTQFDPRVAEAFLEIPQEEWERLRREAMSSPSPTTRSALQLDRATSSLSLDTTSSSDESGNA